MKIKCVILDDEAENLKSLQQVIESIDDVEVVRSFTDAKTFTDGIKEISFDMCILDNHLPDGRGVDLAKSLKGKKVIFVSAHEVSAYDAFDVNAIDVIKKPVTSERLEKAIKKCRDRIINEKGYVYFRTASMGKTRFKLNDIVYITTEKDGKYIVTMQEKLMLAGRRSLEEIMEKLPDTFCIINKGEILNHSYLKSFKETDTILIDYIENKKYKEMYVGEKYINVLNSRTGNDIEF